MIKDQTKQWQNKTEKEPCANKKIWKNYRKHTKTNQYFNWLVWTHDGMWGLSIFCMGKIFLCWEEEIVHMNILRFSYKYMIWIKNQSKHFY